MNPTPSPAAAPDTPRLAWGAIGLAIVALLFGLVALVVAIGADDDAAVPADSGEVIMTESLPSSTTPSVTDTPATTPSTIPATSPTISEPTQPSTIPPSSPTTTATPPDSTDIAPSTILPPTTASPEISAAIWPRAGSTVRYDDPVDAARAFAVEFVGFDPVIVGEFQAGDSRSGDVEVRSRPNGQATVVHVRQVEGDDWAVIGASNVNITVTQPNALAEIESPMMLTGSATAFEGTVEVLLYADGSEQPVVEGFVTGSGGPDPGPFTDIFEWNAATSEGATLLLRSTSPEDGSIVDATATRLRFRAVTV